MPDGRFGDIDHPDGGGRFGDVEYSALNTLAVQSAVHGHSADNVDLTSKSISAGEASDVPGGTITFTLTDFVTVTGVTINGVTAAFSGDTSSIDVTLPAYEDFAEGGAHEATPWESDLDVVVSDAGGNASTTIQIDPLETEGDYWWLQAVAPAGDAIDAPGIDVGDYFSAERLYGTGVQLQANRSSSAASETWGIALKYWDGSAWSAVTPTHFPIWLTVADAAHSHAADGITLSGLTTALTINSALHATTAEAIDLGVAYVISVAEALHATSADSVSVVEANILAVQEAAHSHTVNTLEIGAGGSLLVAPAAHSHAADGITLTASQLLGVQEALHAVLGEAPSLTQDSVLVVSEALHAHVSEQVQFGPAAPTIVLSGRWTATIALVGRWN